MRRVSIGMHAPPETGLILSSYYHLALLLSNQDSSSRIQHFTFARRLIDQNKSMKHLKGGDLNRV
jgi:hypothetical protein